MTQGAPGYESGVSGLYKGRLWEWQRFGAGWGVKIDGEIIELPVRILLHSSSFCCCHLVAKSGQLRSVRV